MRIWKCPAILAALLAVSPAARAAVPELGALFSPRGAGLRADWRTDGIHTHNISYTADLLDIISGKASNPGAKFSYHCSFDLKTMRSHSGNIYTLYAGPGVSCGLVRNVDNKKGFMTGVSGIVGGRMACYHNMHLGIEFSIDAGLIFKNRDFPYMTLYKAGYSRSYLPYLIISKCF